VLRKRARDGMREKHKAQLAQLIAPL